MKSQPMKLPPYGVEVEATTIDGKTGIWSRGDYGWYPKGRWGVTEYAHTHIVAWKYLPNETSQSVDATEKP